MFNQESGAGGEGFNLHPPLLNVRNSFFLKKPFILPDSGHEIPNFTLVLYFKAANLYNHGHGCNFNFYFPTGNLSNQKWYSLLNGQHL